MKFEEIYQGFRSDFNPVYWILTGYGMNRLFGVMIVAAVFYLFSLSFSLYDAASMSTMTFTTVFLIKGGAGLILFYGFCRGVHEIHDDLYTKRERDFKNDL